MKRVHNMSIREMTDEYNQLTGSKISHFRTREVAETRLTSARKAAKEAAGPKKQPRATRELYTMYASGRSKDEIVERAKTRGYSDTTAEVMFFVAQEAVRLDRIEKYFNGRKPTEDEFVTIATEQGMRPTSARKRYMALYH